MQITRTQFSLNPSANYLDEKIVMHPIPAVCLVAVSIKLYDQLQVRLSNFKYHVADGDATIPCCKSLT